MVGAIEVARGHGDLSENADYSAAKEEQGLIEAKIRELEAKTAMAEVIDPTKLSGSRVKFGATVTIAETESGESTSKKSSRATAAVVPWISGGERGLFLTGSF